MFLTHVHTTCHMHILLTCLMKLNHLRYLYITEQELRRLEEVKQKLQSQFDREPTLIEWAEAVGMSSGTLQLHLRLGNKSREKMIYSNFRMVVHVAKNYQGKGLNLQDLLQVSTKTFLRNDVSKYMILETKHM